MVLTLFSSMQSIQHSVSSWKISLPGLKIFLALIRRTRRNLKLPISSVLIFSELLCPHATVNDEVDGAVDDEKEVLDGGESEHPAGV